MSSGRKFDPSVLSVPGQQQQPAYVGAPVQPQQQQDLLRQLADQQAHIQYLQQQHKNEMRLLVGDDIPTEKQRPFGTGAEKEGTFTFRFAFMPYRESGDINWGAYIRWWFLLLLMSIIQATVMARVASGLSSSVPALNSVLLGLAYMGTTVFALSWRQSFNLRLHTHQSVVAFETFHAHVGFVNMLVILAWNTAGSALSGLFQKPGLLNCAAVPGAPYPAAPGVTFWGALGIDAALGVLVTLAYGHNIPLMYHGVARLLPSETKNNRFGVSNVALLFGLALFLGTLVGFPSGVWAMGNSVIYIGGAITLGASTPFEWAWFIPLIAPFFYGGIAFGIHLLTFNVNGLSKEDFLLEGGGGAGEEGSEEPEVSSASTSATNTNVNARIYDKKKK